MHCDGDDDYDGNDDGLLTLCDAIGIKIDMLQATFWLFFRSDILVLRHKRLRGGILIRHTLSLQTPSSDENVNLLKELSPVKGGEVTAVKK